MSKRRDSPALFEIVRSQSARGAGDRPDSSASQAEPPAEATQPAASRTRMRETDPAPASANSDEPGSALGEIERLGRTVRIPIGFVVLGIAGTIMLLVVAYSVGFSRGRATLSEIGPTTNPNPEIQSPGSQGDPLEGREFTVTDLDRLEHDDSTSRVADSTHQTNTEISRENRPNDTRQAGLNYIVVEQFPVEEADRVADFLAQSGIDVMVLPSNNRGLREIIVRRGFDGWLSNPEAQELMQAIKRLGRQWKASGGSKDFSQAYGDKFDG